MNDEKVISPISLSPLETLSSDLLNLDDQTAVYYGVGAMATVLCVFTTVTAKAKIRVETSGDVNSQAVGHPEDHIIVRWTVFLSGKRPMFSYWDKLMSEVVINSAPSYKTWAPRANFIFRPLHEYIHVENNFK